MVLSNLNSGMIWKTTNTAVGGILQPGCGHITTYNGPGQTIYTVPNNPTIGDTYIVVVGMPLTSSVLSGFNIQASPGINALFFLGYGIGHNILGSYCSAVTFVCVNDDVSNLGFTILSCTDYVSVDN